MPTETDNKRQAARDVIDILEDISRILVRHSFALRQTPGLTNSRIPTSAGPSYPCAYH